MAKRKIQNHAAIREWLNVMAAVGALLVGLVSFWTTARISGLEDYLRSEIGRRNSELNALSERSERAMSLAERRSAALSDLQFSADKLTASFASTQSHLEEARGELTELQIKGIASQMKLSDLNLRALEQGNRIDLLNRRRVYQQVSLFTTANLMLFPNTKKLGVEAFEMVVYSSAPTDEPDLIPYYSEMRSAAALTCKSLRSYAPVIPAQQEYPARPSPPGEPVDGSANLYSMTIQQKADWEKSQEQWSAQWSQTSRANGAAGDYSSATKQYAAGAAGHCACLALATEKHPASIICPNSKPAEEPKPYKGAL